MNKMVVWEVEYTVVRKKKISMNEAHYDSNEKLKKRLDSCARHPDYLEQPAHEILGYYRDGVRVEL